MANDSDKNTSEDAIRLRKEPRADSSKPLLPRERLPKDLQKLVENEETLAEQIYDGTAGESTDSNLRYAAYASRLRTILMSAHRYVAYTSDIGESFRPIAHPYLIKGAYAISWAYLAGDVGHEGYKAYLRNQRILHPGQPGLTSRMAGDVSATETSAWKEKGDSSILTSKAGVVPPLEDYRTVMVQRAIFQGLASMGLPAFTIHSIVRYSGRALKNAKNTTIRSYGPIGLGLAAVPFLPFIFDKPVEEAVEWTFHKAFATAGGHEAVQDRPTTGRSDALQAETTAHARKEKEL
ncbi:MAG: hypothetical protein M1827_003958 [Pycnora praestabilis]|nr:MAG: hypothetical protein M1827_003958 [Pycnora praestabilis]